MGMLALKKSGYFGGGKEDVYKLLYTYLHSFLWAGIPASKWISYKWHFSGPS